MGAEGGGQAWSQTALGLNPSGEQWTGPWWVSISSCLDRDHITCLEVYDKD